MFPILLFISSVFVLYFIFANLKSIKLIDGSARMKQIYIGLDCWICGAIQIVCSLILILDNLLICILSRLSTVESSTKEVPYKLIFVRFFNFNLDKCYIPV